MFSDKDNTMMKHSTYPQNFARELPGVRGSESLDMEFLSEWLC